MPVSKFEITSQSRYADGRRFGSAGAYVQYHGRLHFAVDAAHPANAHIVDLPLAPRNEKGQVCFAADFLLLTPETPLSGNARAIVELPNRGRRLLVPLLNRVAPGSPPHHEPPPGDGFLFRHGFTIASIGWQWDVYPSAELMGLDAPEANEGGRAVCGETVVEIRPSERTRTWLLADRTHRPLPAASQQTSRTRLLVRDYEDGEDALVPAEAWQFARETEAGEVVPCPEHVYLASGFEPGCIYHLVYETDRAPVVGAGLLAVRDVAEFLREDRSDNPTSGTFGAVYAWGISQTGRMLRHFLSLGLNRTETGSTAYDGILAHVAGARRGAFNHRFAQPSNQTTPLWGHVFPFADLPIDDAFTGENAGLLDRQRELGSVPKIVYTNTSAEYWRGDGALAHIHTNGASDLSEPDCVRSYLFAGTQHSPGYHGQSRTHPGTKSTARYRLNVVDHAPLVRSALINLDRWVTEGLAPPPSRHPRLADRSAVIREDVLARYAGIPEIVVPDPERLPVLRTVDLGAPEHVGVGRYPAKEGAVYPALVSAVDSDGNELAGIRLPDISVPVASHAGWNPRDPKTGAPEQIVSMNGMTSYFPKDAATREQTGDPRRSVAERYGTREAYEAQVRVAAQALVDERYLLAEDEDAVVERAVSHFDEVMKGET